jgi:hypothetical protein
MYVTSCERIYNNDEVYSDRMRGFFSGQTRIFYILLSAGTAFTMIGIASAVYTNIPVEVGIDASIKPGLTDTLTPNMNRGNSAHIVIRGSSFNANIKDPSKLTLESKNGASAFNYDLIAQKEGQYLISIKNTGRSDLIVSGHAQTKGSIAALPGQIMLIITGVVLAGFGIRLRNQ